MELSQETLDTIEEVVGKLARKFIFAHYSIEDIKQEARLIALEGMERYDGVRSLKNYLYTHVKNRLCNLKRDKYERLTKPCEKCPLKAYVKCEDLCTAYEDKMECDIFNKWHYRNVSKKNLMMLGSISDADLDYEQRIPSLEIRDILNSLPIEYRSDYLKMLHDVKISKPKRERLKLAIEKILEERGITIDDLI